jgi:hypothetical protein
MTFHRGSFERPREYCKEGGWDMARLYRRKVDTDTGMIGFTGYDLSSPLSSELGGRSESYFTRCCSKWTSK